MPALRIVCGADISLLHFVHDQNICADWHALNNKKYCEKKE